MKSTKDNATEIAIHLAKTFEGLSLTPYIDPVGVPTIGYGTVYKPDGTKVTMDHPPITKEMAEDWLEYTMLNTYMIGVVKASGHLVFMPRILGAMSDFAYNLGVPRYRASTLRRKINAQEWDEAADELMKWVNGGGRRLQGLVRRRAAESVYLEK